MAAVSLNVAANGIHGTFTDHPLVDVNPAHPGLGGKGHEGGVQRLQIALAQIKALLCQHHDAAAFRRFVGQRRELGGIGKGFLFHALRGQER